LNPIPDAVDIAGIPLASNNKDKQNPCQAGVDVLWTLKG
jgi:hypothetical protein